MTTTALFLKTQPKQCPKPGSGCSEHEVGGFRGSQSEWLRSEVEKLVRFPKFLGTYGLFPPTDVTIIASSKPDSISGQ